MLNILSSKDGRQYRAFDLQPEGNKIEGYAVVFEQKTLLDRDPFTGTEFFEMISKNAFDGCDMSDVVLNVDHEGAPIARTKAGNLVLQVDDHGLKVSATLTTTRGHEVWEEIQAGNLSKMSFAFNIEEQSYNKAERTNTITKIGKLWDVAVVTFPAYEQTCVFARSGAAGHIAEEQRSYVHRKITDMGEKVLPPIPEMRKEDRFAGLEYDLDRLKSLEQKACDIRSWKPEGVPDDVNTVNEKSDMLASIISEIEELNRDIAEKIERVERHSSNFYGWGGLQMVPNTEEQMRAFAKRKIPLKTIAIEGIPKELLELYDSINPEYGYSKRYYEPPPDFKNFTKKQNSFNYERSKNTMNEMANAEKRKFFDELVEQRAAGSTSTMTNVIPTTILDQFIIEKAPGAFLEDATKTAIDHAGNLVLPIATLQTVEEHTENAAITTNGYVPGKLTISHSEYAYNTGYSAMGVRIAAGNLETIVTNTLMASMLKKMDGICLDAVAGLSYTDDTNAVKLAASTAPTFTDMVKLAGMLGPDFIDNAQWYVSSSTYFNWLLSLKDDQKRPILDPSKPISEQAPLGYRIRIDSQIPANVVYFGDGRRIHLNYAGQPEINLWTDFDTNTEKAGVRCVAGAASEIGSFVKMYQGA